MKGYCGDTWKLINCWYESPLENIWLVGNFKLQAGECSTGHFFGGNSVLWTGGECYYQIQVMPIVTYYEVQKTQ